MTYLRAAHDPYLIAGTDVLRNLAGASSAVELAAVENDLCTARSIELHRSLPKAKGTLAQLQWIHRQLFRDVYDWAGEIRVIDMAKGDGEPFQPLEFFDMGVIYSERVLREDNLLRGLPFETFIERLSVSYNNFNILHPFRKGNGRAQRVFWDVVARDAGWHFDWGLVGRRENDLASIAAMRSNDLGPLERMFARIAKPPAEPLVTGVRFSHLMDGEYQEQPNVGYRLSKDDYQTLRVKYSYQMPQE